MKRKPFSRRKFRAHFSLALLLLTGRCMADTPAPTAAPAHAKSSPKTAAAVAKPAAQPAATDETLTCPDSYNDTLEGGLFGYRKVLASHGIELGGFYLNDTSWNLLGGISTRKTINRSLLDLEIKLNTDPLFGWRGGKVVGSVRFHFGPNGNNQQLGSIQGYSLIDYNPPATQLYELYYQQTLLHGNWKLRIGTMDANAIFDIPADGAIFVNPSSEDPPLFLQPAPAFSAPGLTSIYQLTPTTTLLAGVFYDGRFHPTVFDSFLNAIEPVNQPVGAFLTAELDQNYQLSSRQPGTIGIGGFFRTGQFSTLNDGTQTDAGGGYLFIDQTLWQTPHAVHRLAAFFNITGNDPRVSEIDNSIQSGVLATGLIPGRDNDQIGLGLDWAHLSSRAHTPDPYELVLEGFYAISLGRGVTLQPDLQYFADTAGGLYPNGLMAMIRVNLNF